MSHFNRAVNDPLLDGTQYNSVTSKQNTNKPNRFENISVADAEAYLELTDELEIALECLQNEDMRYDCAPDVIQPGTIHKAGLEIEKGPSSEEDKRKSAEKNLNTIASLLNKPYGFGEKAKNKSKK